MAHSRPNQTNADGERQARVPEPEVLPRAKRRQFSAEYKLGILQEADACTKLGQIGALLAKGRASTSAPRATFRRKS